MSQQYGQFAKSIMQLDAAQERVRATWCDDTARSYEPLNNNVKLCAQKIWAFHCDSQSGVELVKKNYNSDEIEKEIARLGAQVEQV